MPFQIPLGLRVFWRRGRAVKSHLNFLQLFFYLFKTILSCLGEYCNQYIFVDY